MSRSTSLVWTNRTSRSSSSRKRSLGCSDWAAVMRVSVSGSARHAHDRSEPSATVPERRVADRPGPRGRGASLAGVAPDRHDHRCQIEPAARKQRSSPARTRASAPRQGKGLPSVRGRSAHGADGEAVVEGADGTGRPDSGKVWVRRKR